MRALDRRRCVGILLAVAVLPGWCLAARRKDSRDQWQQRDRVVADLGLKDGSRIADIGCGRGYFTFHLAKAVGEKGKVFATEISSNALKAVSERVKKENLANVEPVLSNPTDTKLATDSLDAAFICNVYHHVSKEHRAALSRDIVRALKPGGFLFIVDWRVDAKIRYDIGRRIPRDDLVKFAKDAGLTLDAEFYYLEHQVYLRCRKPDKPK